MGTDDRLADHLSLRAAYGWKIDDSGLGDVEDGKFHFGVMMRDGRGEAETWPRTKPVRAEAASSP